MKRASYRFGVQWIALNDDVLVRDPDEVRGQISVLLLADLFGVESDRVAADVLRYRARAKV